MNKIIICLIHVYVLYCIDSIISVPPPYCLKRFNSSDCFQTPTPVFSYYKPGSRCEIEIWRGCPTMNKFDDEYLCSHFCTGKFLHIFSDDFKTEQSTCYETFNRSKCTKQVDKVYTYNKDSNTCEPAEWRGCNTGNKFPDEITCTTTCKSDDKENDFEKELMNLEPNNAEKVDSILDSIIGKGKKELKLTKPYKKHITETIIPKTEQPTTTTEPMIQSTQTEPYSDDTKIDEDTTATSIMTTSSTTTLATTILTEPSTETEDITSKPDTTTEKTTVDVMTTSVRPSGTVEEVVLPDDGGDEYNNR